MKNKDLIPLLKELSSNLPGFVFHKRILLISPIDNILQAIHFDTNGYDKDGFNIDVFVMPLCVPQDDVHFTFGDRVDDPKDVWKMSMPDLGPRVASAIRDQAIPFLAQRATLLDFADRMAWRNPHAPMAAAYALARAGEIDRAISTVDALLPMLHLDVGWERDIGNDVTALRTMLLENPPLAQAKLREWETYTIQKLGLAQYC